MTCITAFTRWFLLALYILLLIFVVFFVFPFLGTQKKGRAVKFLASLVPKLLGLNIVVKGELPKDRLLGSGMSDSTIGYMVCANHVSFIDIFVIDSLMPVRFVAKKEIESWPIFGPIAKAAGTIFIDRTKKRAVLEVSEVMSSSLETRRNVIFFPEGTTGTGEKLLPFHANLFSSAVKSNAKIIPITLRYMQGDVVTTKPSYAERTLLDVLKILVCEKNIYVEVQVLPIISPEGKNRKELTLEASRLMSEALGVPDATLIKEKEQLEVRKKLKDEACTTQN